MGQWRGGIQHGWGVTGPLPTSRGINTTPWLSLSRMLSKLTSPGYPKSDNAFSETTPDVHSLSLDDKSLLVLPEFMTLAKQNVRGLCLLLNLYRSDFFLECQSPLGHRWQDRLTVFLAGCGDPREPHGVCENRRGLCC